MATTGTNKSSETRRKSGFPGIFHARGRTKGKASGNSVKGKVLGNQVKL